MAAAYLEHHCRMRNLGVEVESAGLLGIEGEPASPEGVRVLAEAGIDASAHRSRGLCEEQLERADLVLVMTAAHRDQIERRFPGRTKAIALLRAYNGSFRHGHGTDLADPDRRLRAMYRGFATIRACVDTPLRRLEPGA
jgi:protein-tyrosine-phosphatase